MLLLLNIVNMFLHTKTTIKFIQTQILVCSPAANASINTCIGAFAAGDQPN